ncbi:NFX1-type zinc finger-containing protein 1-like [Ctenocephalides felis]|uniref:NFX1-type zinc finger-containing protein 1-like n=1 Tax=Ctenocephalides felis TaxID=7515 RepID=UPI000E6E4FC1|nr:NFX1-type zinc finger-containing protein 1-like [Ctenocephalides felis]
MADYIIKNKNAIKHPKYSADIISYEYKGNELSIFDLSSWPKSDILGLNDSQLEAIKAALTEELVLIQGPPGTGKTFVGAEIASILLQNLRNQQILVVCYTNQALDNFLKKLIPVTENIVRVGNQSTDPTLAQYHINNRKHGKSNTMMKAMGSIETEIFEILKEIKMYQNLIRTLSSKRGILSMSKNSFATELEDKHWLPVNTNILSPLSSWLLGSSKDRCFIPNYNASIRNIIDVDTVYNKVCYDEKDDLNIFTNLKHLESSLSNLKLDCELEYEVTLENLQTSLHKLNDEIKRKSEQAHNEEYIKEIQNEKQDLEFWLEHLKARMEIGPIQNQKQFSTASATALNFDDRWSLYWHWVDMLQKDYLHKYKECTAEYQSLLKQYEELKFIQYMKFLKDAKVIGMTTTSAARIQIILKELKIPIYIFEEAAEIPEAHVIASLTKHCEHLIMIGDHKQLQPHNASYELSKISNINISLFERLINNGLPYHTLNTQYRMKPKICSLISPIIYENLENGGQTLNYRNIKGFKHNLYFVNHNVPEDHKLDTTSCKNTHEAKFIVKLCHYLKLNQYGSKDITILSTYSGQVQAIENEMKHIDMLQKVKVSTVDNFQGQENRIILLSLVRSNKDANIGFLNKQNRICVALSRAMEGLFIIGNMENLSRDTYIWTQIKNVLEEQRAIGSHLPLSIKTKTGTWEFQVQTSEDFDEPISYLLS